MIALLLFLLGGAVGAYGTLIGAGGGFVLMPLLLFLYPREAVTALTSLSLSVVALNAASGTAVYASQRRIDYRLALLVAAASVPCSMVGARITAFLAREAFEVVFGGILLALAAIVIVRPPGGRLNGPDPVDTLAPTIYSHMGFGVTLSGLVGGLAGILGIGGAPPQVVVLTHVMQVPVWRAMPTVQLVVLLSALGAVAIHMVGGHYRAGWGELLPLGAGALLGAQLGAWLSRRLSSVTLIRLLAVALVLVGGGLLVKSFR